MTPAQRATLQEVLDEFIDNESDILRHAFNNELSRKEFLERYTKMLNVGLILEQEFGYEGIVEAISWTPEQLNKRMKGLI